ncbi:hypothetical protein BS50DRAFT_497172 [Corynespora cassiicola Philippines]|uniref:Uncharacterized protein n=1 Tax=Corynespora cassiicola Philippines TaxID=1448308 RepID=A0A2T2NHR8_CORCC|nr:hypothetical protein BS50DRAFT_497172 [Corynespora cassiicola Philippines]
MGRQAYLTKIALGRSAFEPSQTITQSSEYQQVYSSQREVPEALRDSSVNRYIQLYDERGNPINPGAHEHGRRFREAQNDVLASIGVVERRRSHVDGLPGSYQKRLERIEDENFEGIKIGHASDLVTDACTWWVGSIRNRVLTFRYENAMPFANIVAAERQRSEKALFYAGFASHLVNNHSFMSIVYLVEFFRPIDHLLHATRATQKTRRFCRRWRNTARRCLELSLKLILYPITYHTDLRTLGLIPARPLLSSWRALIPFSAWSPVFPLSLHPTPSAATTTDLFKTLVNSPLLFLCLEYIVERWVTDVVSDIIEASIVQPDNPDIPFGDDNMKRRAVLVSRQQKSYSVIRDGINKVLVTLGWGEPFFSGEEAQQASSSHGGPEATQNETIEVGSNQITNLRELQIPEAHAEVAQLSGGDRLRTPPESSIEVMPPPSPTASEASQHDNDPRIRITSREGIGIVEMEVRLPPRILSTHTEIVDDAAPGTLQHGGADSLRDRSASDWVFHRVTMLSMEPARMIGKICKMQIVGLAALPFRTIRLQLTAAHFLARHGGTASVSMLQDSSMQAVTTVLSRVALCTAVELAIDLGVWGCQYLFVTWVGKQSYGWGAL